MLDRFQFSLKEWNGGRKESRLHLYWGGPFSDWLWIRQVEVLGTNSYAAALWKCRDTANDFKSPGYLNQFFPFSWALTSFSMRVNASSLKLSFKMLISSSWRSFLLRIPSNKLEILHLRRFNLAVTLFNSSALNVSCYWAWRCLVLVFASSTSIEKQLYEWSILKRLTWFSIVSIFCTTVLSTNFLFLGDEHFLSGWHCLCAG